ncbi:hypothetical protein Lfu02_73110 [Longispora fulva]|nr:hypothetical protein Lfu02_73110 [Longispora fulva]
MRWQINYRFVDCCNGYWYYRADTLNVAHRPVEPDAICGELLERRTKISEEFRERPHRGDPYLRPRQRAEQPRGPEAAV